MNIKHTNDKKYFFCDVHTHILPEMDDGAYNLWEATQLLDMLIDEGVHEVCFTPHYYAFEETVDRYLARRDKRIELIQPHVEKRQLKTTTGSEIYLCEELFDCKSLEGLNYKDTEYILLEFPYQKLTYETIDLLEQFCIQFPFRPILAHIDRYELFTNNSLRKHCRDLGCLFQMNLDALSSSRKMVRQAVKLIKKGEIDCFGTDCHNVIWRRPVVQQHLHKLAAAGLRDELESIYASNLRWFNFD
ncbi:MAG TPA: hypothetical protein GX717_06115 [Clostridiaceae bacterium]|nr:hypothetical protein [Clostridiaceae bacterium]